MIPENPDQFSVVQFFIDGSQEYVRRNVSAEEALKALKHYTSNVATKLGVVNRVILTDGGDFTNIEWINGKGFTYDGEHYAESPHTSLHPNVKSS
jgi:hypothetical protein